MLVLYGAGGRHLSADDVWQAITHEHAIDRSTAYRILGDLCAAGLIHAVRLSDGLVRYEMRATVHHHAVCTGCGATVDVGIDAVAGLASALEHDFGFKLGAESLLLPGQCRDCSTR